jgi:hypothetical protein
MALPIMGKIVLVSAATTLVVLFAVAKVPPLRSAIGI